MTRTFKLEELAAEAGVSPRTVRYYVQRGLLPAPPFRGKDTAYDRSHLVRLRAIKQMQEAHLPLDEIQVRLANMTVGEVEKLLERGFEKPAQTPFEEQHNSGSGKKGRHPYRSSGRGDLLPEADLDSEAPPFDSVATAHVYRLAPGVELLVRSGLDAASRALVREILTRYFQPEKDERR